MLSIAELWLPILVSAVLVFVVSSVIHMVLPIHRNDFTRVPDEDRILDALRGTPPGQYMFPAADSMKDLQTPEMQEKFKVGPVGHLLLRPNGPPAIGGALLKWFVFALIVSAFCGYLTGIGHGVGTDGSTVFRFAGTVALLGYGFMQFHEWTWKSLATSTMLKFVVDGVIYSLVTAGVFAWLWPAA